MMRDRRATSWLPFSVLFPALLCFAILLPAFPAGRSSVASPAEPEVSAPLRAQDASNPVIAFRRGGDVWLMNADGSDQRQITDYQWGVTQYAWSPSGRYLLLSHGGRYWHGTLWRNGDPPDMRFSLYDVTAGELRDLIEFPDPHPDPQTGFPVWAENADELIMEVPGRQGSTVLVKLGLDGSTSPVASYYLPPTCGGPSGPIPVTGDLLSIQELDSRFSPVAHQTLIWWADQSIAYVNTFCRRGIALDLATSEMTEYPGRVWLAVGPGGRILVQSDAWTADSTAGTFDPATGVTTPIEAGTASAWGTEYGWGPGGALYITTVAEVGESAFTSVFDDFPSPYTDNRIEVWETGGQGGGFRLRRLVTTLDVYGTGIPGLTPDGSALIMGVVDNPTAMMEVDTSQYSEYSPEIYAAHQRIVRVEIETGEVTELATNAHRPRVQPAGDAVLTGAASS